MKKTGREDQENTLHDIEMTALYEISRAITSSLNLEEVMTRVMEIIHEKLGMERGTLTLLDSRTSELMITW